MGGDKKTNNDLKNTFNKLWDEWAKEKYYTSNDFSTIQSDAE